MDKNTWDEIIKHGAYVAELDWFAIDNKGQIGLFTATMDAPIPQKVKQSFETYKVVKETIDALDKTTSSTLTTNENGNFKDWLDYADKGLFSFDFQDVHRTMKKNLYDLIAKPNKPLHVTELRLAVGNFVKLDCEFDKGDLPIDKVK